VDDAIWGTSPDTPLIQNPGITDKGTNSSLVLKIKG